MRPRHFNPPILCNYIYIHVHCCSRAFLFIVTAALSISCAQRCYGDEQNDCDWWPKEQGESTWNSKKHNYGCLFPNVFCDQLIWNSAHSIRMISPRAFQTLPPPQAKKNLQIQKHRFGSPTFLSHIPLPHYHRDEHSRAWNARVHTSIDIYIYILYVYIGGWGVTPTRKFMHSWCEFYCSAKKQWWVMAQPEQGVHHGVAKSLYTSFCADIVLPHAPNN